MVKFRDLAKDNFRDLLGISLVLGMHMIALNTFSDQKSDLPVLGMSMTVTQLQ